MTALRLVGVAWLAVAALVLVACVTPTAWLERVRVRRALRRGR